MKVFKLEKRLILGKETVAHLMQSESNSVKGGIYTRFECVPGTKVSECYEGFSCAICPPETTLC